MDQEYSIEVNDVYKSFKSYKDKSNTLKDALSRMNFKSESKNRTILSGISFKIPKGQAVGLIGKNGCGKSTTLKLLTKILNPDKGTIKINGRVASLIELGAGFHPDMTGRENVYINASIFGISRKEVDKRIEKIIEFSELEDFIDEPVRTYSSGMYMRLAFSVAVNVEPDILLIDEILAVGDARFQEKCFDWIKNMKRSGITIVIVSHSQDQIEKICDKAIWIDKGKIREQGNPHDVCNDYLMELNKKDTQVVYDVNEFISENKLIAYCDKMRRTDNNIANTGRLMKAQINEIDENKILMGTNLKLSLEYRLNEKILNLLLQVIIRKTDGRPIASGMKRIKGEEIGDYNTQIMLQTELLAPDDYNLQFVLIQVHELGTMEKLDSLDKVLQFNVYCNDKWNLDKWGSTCIKIFEADDI